ncbi:MAG: amidohydrolase family protein [Acidobacteriota bacterium]
MRSTLFLVAVAAIGLLCGTPVNGQSYAITNARIVTVSGATIDSGTVVIRDGLIEAVGPNLKPPADAKVFDATGLTVYPGFIDALTNLGMPAGTPPPVRGAAPTAAMVATSNSNYPAGLRPEEAAEDELRGGDTQFEMNRNAGFTTALTTGRTGIFNGQSAIIDLSGDSVSAFMIRSPFAQHVSFATVGGGVYPGSLLGTFSALRQMMYDAQRLQALQKQYAANPKGMKRPDADKSLEALFPVVDRRMPIVFNANSERDIIRALDLIKEFKLNGMIAGGQESWKVADRLKAANVPVLLSLNFPKRTTAMSPEADPETMETLRLRAETPKGPAKLAAAGVRFAFESDNARSIGDFFTNAGRAVDAGLSRDIALRAMTLASAEILGVDDRLGSIEPGKIANLVVIRGDLFGKDKYVTHVFVDGKYYDQKAPPKVTPQTTRGQGENAAGLPNVAGAYAINIEVPGQPIGATLTLAQQGASLTGTLVSQLGTAPIRDGKMTADGFSFTATVDFGGSTIDIIFRGTVNASQISGTIDSPQGVVPFSGTKTP